VSDFPVACTLSAHELACQAERLIPGLAAGSSSIAWVDTGVEMVLDAVPGQLERIASVIERERHCCQFLRFELTVPPGGEPFQLRITGPDGTVAFLESILAPAADVPAR
jgi:hypothetical protein